MVTGQLMVFAHDARGQSGNLQRGQKALGPSTKANGFQSRSHSFMLIILPNAEWIRRFTASKCSANHSRTSINRARSQTLPKQRQGQ